MLIGRGDNIKKDEIGGARGTCGGEQKCIGVMAGKPGGKKPLGRSRSRWENKIKRSLKKKGW